MQGRREEEGVECLHHGLTKSSYCLHCNLRVCPSCASTSHHQHRVEQVVAREEGLARLLKQTVGELGARLQGITGELARVEAAREEGARVVGQLRGKVEEYYTHHMEEVPLLLLPSSPPPRWPPTPRPWMGRCSSMQRGQTMYCSGNGGAIFWDPRLIV